MASRAGSVSSGMALSAAPAPARALEKPARCACRNRLALAPGASHVWPMGAAAPIVVQHAPSVALRRIGRDDDHVVLRRIARVVVTVPN